MARLGDGFLALTGPGWCLGGQLDSRSSPSNANTDTNANTLTLSLSLGQPLLSLIYPLYLPAVTLHARSQDNTHDRRPNLRHCWILRIQRARPTLPLQGSSHDVILERAFGPLQIASSRRTTPEHPVRSQQGFPQPPTQRFQAPVIPSVEGSNQRVKQPCVQLNSQDVRMDPRFRHPPPHYSQIPLHRQIPPIEVNELGPTIQQGVIQRPKERAEGNIEGRLQTEVRNEQLSEKNDGTNIAQSFRTRPNVRQHNIKVLPEGYQLALNETVRPVFVNHYYAGEAVVSGTNRRYIRLDDCDVLSESVQGMHQTQAVEHEFIEHLRELLPTRCPPSKMTKEVITEEERLTSQNVSLHRKIPEHFQNSLKGTVRRETSQTQANEARGEYREPSQHSPETMNVGKSRVQAANRRDPKHVPLTGYEHYHQEITAYPINREPLNVQPTIANDNSALLDLPNMQTGLPEPLIPHQVNPPATTQVEEEINNPAPMESNLVTNTQILESIQNITKVMQQQLIFNGKTTES